MKISHGVYATLLLLSGCNNGSHIESGVSRNSHVAIAKKFIDAFYSFDKESLQSMLSHAEKSQPSILYYQKWAECGNYRVLSRDKYVEKNDSVVIFPVTVKDDLMGALKIDFNVTDTFHISIRDGKIRSVETSSNDLDTYYKAKEWVKKNRLELIEKACEGAWEGGATPCACVQGMVKGFAAFTSKEQAK